MEKNYYVYRHRRLDTFEIFYIGLGNVYLEHKDSKTSSVFYRRAYNTKGRNNWWKKVVNKTDYQVEILSTNLTKEDACELEEFLIQEYGRRDLGLGNLINMTDGGENNSGKIVSSEMKEKIRKTLTGKYPGELNPFYKRIHSEETRKQMSINHADFSGKNHPKAKKVIDTVSKKVFDCAKDASVFLGMDYRTFTDHLKNKSKNKTTFIYLEDYTEGMVIIPSTRVSSKIVLNLETGIFYNSGKEASKVANIYYSTFKSMLNGTLPNKTSFQYV